MRQGNCAGHSPFRIGAEGNMMLLEVSTPWLQAVPAFLIAGIVTLAAVPLSMMLARHVGAVAQPDARKLHARPTPQLGGVAMAAGFLVALAVYHGSITMVGIIAAALVLIVVVMTLDDIYELHWWMKLVPEILVGIMLAAGGVAITFVALPGGAHGAHIVELGVLAVPVTVVWVVGMQNSINLLDGSDGVAAGVVAIVAIVSLLAAVTRSDVAQTTESGVIIMSGALCGVCIAFLVFNLPPAQVFMGDSGSHFLGTAIAIITILAVAKLAVALSLLVPLIALGLPIGDTAAAIIRRKWNGKGIMEADAGHLHHRLRALGLTPMETAVTFYVITAVLGCISLFIIGHQRVLAVIVALFIIVLVGIGARLYARNRTESTATSAGELTIEVEGRREFGGRGDHEPHVHRHGGDE